MMTEDSITKNCIENFFIIKYDKNQWVYTKYLTKLIRGIEKKIIERIADKLDFEEWIFPNLINMETIKIYGNSSAIKPFYIKNNLILDPLKISLYKVLQNKKLKKQIKVFERNVTFRDDKESKSFHTVNEFRRIDFYYIGKPKEVLAIRNSIIKLFKDYLCEIGIKYRIVDIDKEGHIKEFFYNNLELANIGTKKDVTLKKFNVKNKDLWGGYASIGIDRLLYCILHNSKNNFSYN